MPKTATDLPPPGTKDALSFKGDNENHIKELPRWLENIEVVLRNHGINTDADLKKYIGRYADSDTAEEWQSLETYSKGTFEEHKKAILENYPELKDKLAGSLKRLAKLFKEYQDLTEDDDTEVFSLARKLRPLVAKLSGGTMTITNREIVEKLFNSMTSDFGRAVKTNLEATRRLKGTLDSQKSRIEALEQQGQQQGAAGQNPAGGTYVAPAKRRNDDPYDWEDVLNEMMDIVRHNPVASTWKASSKSRQEHTSSTRVKVEDLQSQLSGFEAQLKDHMRLQNVREDTYRKEMKTWQEEMSRSQQQMLSNLNNPTAGREFSRNTTATWNSGCRYCGDNSHFQNNCPHRQEHARQGLIIPTADGKWHLPNNMQLPPGNGRTLKQRVEDFHAKQQEQASNYYNTYMFLSDEKPTTVWTPQPVHQQFVQSASVYPSPPAPNMSDAIESLMRTNGVSLEDISQFVTTRKKDYGGPAQAASSENPNF